LVALKEFVVEQLSQAPYPWGWGRGATRREDVLGADDEGVTLTGRRVPWAEVGNMQFLALVDHCAARAGVRRSRQANVALAEAIYCFENGGDAHARRYRGQAVNLSSQLADDAQRLVPLE
jgi:putative hemolysin